MCLDDCGDKLSRRQVLVGGVAAAAIAACGEPKGPIAPPAARVPITPVAGLEVSFANGSETVPAKLYRGESRVPLPAVVVGQGNPGFLPYLDELCGRLAGHGYVVLLVDWMGRFPPYPEGDEAQKAWRRQAGSAKLWRGGASHFDAGLDWLGREHLADAGAAAGVGFCGGGIVLAHQSVQSDRLRGLVLFYTNARLSKDFANPDDPLPDLVDLAGRFHAPIQAHYGENDPTARLDDAHEFERRLAAAGQKREFFYYPGAGHGFMKTDEPLVEDRTWGYVPEAAGPAEERMLATVVQWLRHAQPVK